MQATCGLCRKALRSDNRSGYCRDHTPKPGAIFAYKPCRECGDILGKDNRKGICIRCNCKHVGLKYGPTTAGAANGNWKGGRIIDERGYVRVRVGGKERYRREHRVVTENRLGRRLDRKEVVHHENEIKVDNAEENLRLYPNNRQHMRDHFLGRKRDGRGGRWLPRVPVGGDAAAPDKTVLVSSPDGQSTPPLADENARESR